MTDRVQRRTDQQAKIDAMPMTKRLAVVAAGVASTIVAASLVGLLLGGEVDLGLTVGLAIVMGIVFAYQYLWAPTRRP